MHYCHEKSEWPTLHGRDVHLWSVDLNTCSLFKERFSTYLDCEERIRAGRYMSSDQRNEFIASRGILKWILSHYFKSEPQSLSFSYSQQGKPFLVSSCDQSLYFNLSHSNGRMLCGITWVAQIGVDVEYINMQLDFKELLPLVFSPNEIEKLHHVPSQFQRQCFYNCWTRKEAYLKAVGIGLLASMTDLEVTWEPGVSARVLNVLDSQLSSAMTTMLAFDDIEHFTAAAVICGPVQNVMYNHLVIEEDHTQ